MKLIAVRLERRITVDPIVGRLGCRHFGDEAKLRKKDHI